MFNPAKASLARVRLNLTCPASTPKRKYRGIDNGFNKPDLKNTLPPSVRCRKTSVTEAKFIMGQFLKKLCAASVGK